MKESIDNAPGKVFYNISASIGGGKPAEGQFAGQCEQGATLSDIAKKDNNIFSTNAKLDLLSKLDQNQAQEALKNLGISSAQQKGLLDAFQQQQDAVVKVRQVIATGCGAAGSSDTCSATKVGVPKQIARLAGISCAASNGDMCEVDPKAATQQLDAKQSDLQKSLAYLRSAQAGPGCTGPNCNAPQPTPRPD
ncbi:MAG: hypothetical protein Q8P19_03730, partial [bacterium]|nr:hypothetical protein [bacterium]